MILTSRRIVLAGMCAKCGARLRISIRAGSVLRFAPELGSDVDCWCTGCGKKVALTCQEDNRRFVGVEPTEQDEPALEAAEAF